MLTINRFRDFKIQIMLARNLIWMFFDPETALIPLLLPWNRSWWQIAHYFDEATDHLHQTCRLFTGLWSSFIKPFSLSVLFMNRTSRTPSWCSYSFIWSSCRRCQRIQMIWLWFFFFLLSLLQFFKISLSATSGIHHQNIPLDFQFIWKTWPGRNRRTQTDIDLNSQDVACRIHCLWSWSEDAEISNSSCLIRQGQEM